MMIVLKNRIGFLANSTWNALASMVWFSSVRITRSRVARAAARPPTVPFGRPGLPG